MFSTEALVELHASQPSRFRVQDVADGECERLVVQRVEGPPASYHRPYAGRGNAARRWIPERPSVGECNEVLTADFWTIRDSVENHGRQSTEDEGQCEAKPDWPL